MDAVVSVLGSGTPENKFRNMSRSYPKTVALILLIIICCFVRVNSQAKLVQSKSPCPDEKAWTGRYRNYVFGFSIEIPRGLKGYWNSAKCAPDEKYGCVCMNDHGRFIPLSNDAHIEAFVGYQMEPDQSVVDNERQAISSLMGDNANQNVSIVQSRWFRFGRLRARRFEAHFLNKDRPMAVDHIIALHKGVEYELILRTLQARYRKDKAQFEKIIASWRLTPRV